MRNIQEANKTFPSAGNNTLPSPLFARFKSLRMIKPGQTALRGFMGRTFLRYQHGHSNPYLRSPVYTASITLSIKTTGHDEALERGLAGHQKPSVQTKGTEKQKKWGWASRKFLLTPPFQSIKLLLVLRLSINPFRLLSRVPFF